MLASVKKLIVPLACAVLAACGAPAGKGETSAPAVATPLPDYYPADYSKTVEASRSEDGLLIYSNVAEYNWRDILEGFKARYPWIKVSTLDMGPSEVFERYYSETAAKRHSADLIVSGAPDAWQRFVSRDGVERYESPEGGHVPKWTVPMPGVYTFSTDPMILVYNKVLLKPQEHPTTLGSLVELGQRDPTRFKGKLTTYDASSHPFAYAIHWTVVTDQKPGGWDLYTKLAPMTRPESGGATMLDKVTAGEYLAAYYTSAITVFPHMDEPGRDKIVGWVLPTDGTPVMMRGVAVTKAAKSPASSRLMLDYLISHDGQIAAAHGGMTPYRDDITPDEVPYLTLAEVTRRVGGEQNVVMISYRKEMLSGYRTFIDRWNSLFKVRR